MTEQVLVVPRTDLFRGENDVFQGFRRGDVDVFLERVATHGRFVPRAPAEDDPSRKQIIPYGVLSTVDPEGVECVFLMRRKRGGSEARLHDRLSIGVGGHINPIDGENAVASVDLVTRALEREIHEELRVDSEMAISVVGVLNDDSNAVGRVHFGVVYRIRVAVPRVAVRETEQLEGQFVDLRSLEGATLERLETWSRHICGGLDLLGAGGPVDPRGRQVDSETAVVESE